MEFPSKQFQNFLVIPAIKTIQIYAKVIEQKVSDDIKLLKEKLLNKRDDKGPYHSAR
jgi:hypothetical protein